MAIHLYILQLYFSTPAFITDGWLCFLLHASYTLLNKSHTIGNGWISTGLRRHPPSAITHSLTCRAGIFKIAEERKWNVLYIYWVKVEIHFKSCDSYVHSVKSFLRTRKTKQTMHPQQPQHPKLTINEASLHWVNLQEHPQEKRKYEYDA